MVDVSKLSFKELLDLRESIDRQIPETEAREIEALRGKIDKLAAAHGFATVEILSPSGQVRAKKQPARWRDEKTGVEWAGRGRRPHNFDKRRAVAL